MWATIEKLRMRFRTIEFSLTRRVAVAGAGRVALPASAGQRRALGDDGAGLEHDLGPHARVGADLDVRADDAVLEHGAGPDFDALPQDGALDARVRADARAVADDGAGTDATARAERDARAHHRGRDDPGVRPDGAGPVDPAPVAALAGG